MSATLVVLPADLLGEEILVEGDAYRHLFRARRLAVGESIRCVDGEGRARAGRVESVGRREGLVRLGAELPSLEADVDLGLWVALPKGDRASWLIEKATEIGVTQIHFVEFARSVRGPGESQLQRLRRVARAAVEQCGRARVPTIAAVGHLEDQVSRFSGRTVRLDPRAPVPGPGSESPTSGLVVGPEGGLDPREVECLKIAGVRSLGLGPRVLRVETAAIAAASLLLCRSSM